MTVKELKKNNIARNTSLKGIIGNCRTRKSPIKFRNVMQATDIQGAPPHFTSPSAGGFKGMFGGLRSWGYLDPINKKGRSVVARGGYAKVEHSGDQWY